ncbi:MAG: hypothetical protein ACK559_04705, partial [bacterium]
MIVTLSLRSHCHVVDCWSVWELSLSNEKQACERCLVGGTGRPGFVGVQVGSVSYGSWFLGLMPPAHWTNRWLLRPGPSRHPSLNHKC